MAAMIAASTSEGSFSARVCSASTRFRPAWRSESSSIEKSVVANLLLRWGNARRMLLHSNEMRCRPRTRTWSAASVSLAASRVSATTCCRGSTARTLNRMAGFLLVQRDFGSRDADVGVLAGTARLAVAPVGEDVVFPGVAGHAVHVRPAPRVVRQRLLQVRLDRHQSFLRGRVATVFQPVLVEGLLEGINLRPRHLGFGLPDLREVARGDVAGEQADDHDHDQ